MAISPEALAVLVRGTDRRGHGAQHHGLQLWRGRRFRAGCGAHAAVLPSVGELAERIRTSTAELHALALRIKPLEKAARVAPGQ